MLLQGWYPAWNTSAPPPPGTPAYSSNSITALYETYVAGWRNLDTYDEESKQKENKKCSFNLLIYNDNMIIYKTEQSYKLN